MQAHERTAITTTLHPPKVWERFVDGVYFIFKHKHLEKFFHHINNFHQNIDDQYTDQYLHYSSHQQTSCKESVCLFNRVYSIITNKDDLHKENTRIKQVLKENGYQESIISEVFKRITNNHSFPQAQQLTQEEEVRMSISLPKVLVKNYGVSSDLKNKINFLD